MRGAKICFTTLLARDEKSLLDNTLAEMVKDELVDSGVSWMMEPWAMSRIIG